MTFGKRNNHAEKPRTPRHRAERTSVDHGDLFLVSAHDDFRVPRLIDPSLWRSYEIIIAVVLVFVGSVSFHGNWETFTINWTTRALYRTCAEAGMIETSYRTPCIVGAAKYGEALR